MLKNMKINDTENKTDINSTSEVNIFFMEMSNIRDFHGSKKHYVTQNSSICIS